VDVLNSGSERPPLRTPTPPAWLVGLVGVAVLGGGLLARDGLRDAERRAADLADVRVDLQLLDSRREPGGGLFGTLAVSVRDPRGRVRVEDVQVDVPGLAHAPDRSLPRVGRDLGLAVRFVVPECPRLHLPGEVVLRAARGDRPLRAARRPVLQAGAGSVEGSVDGSPLLVACGRLPQPAIGAPD
jgi:hypothetical protein